MQSSTIGRITSPEWKGGRLLSNPLIGGLVCGLYPSSPRHPPSLSMTVRPRLLAAVALGISLVPSGSFALPAGEERPNVLMILADDLGYSDLGCYGSEIPTPNLDRLAAGGVRFTQCTNTSKCFPSRASLLTGCYAQAIGMDRSPAKIVGAPTIGELLREAGYRTLFSGKHHGTENP